MDSRVILLAEDREDDVFITRKVLRDAFVENPINVVKDGEQVISYLSGAGKFSDRSEYPLPVLLLLDLKMPRKNGFEVLTWIRAQTQFRSLPVIVLTSSQELRDMKRAYQAGATSFILKPLGLKEARQISDFLPIPSIALDAPLATPPQTIQTTPSDPLTPPPAA